MNKNTYTELMKSHTELEKKVEVVNFIKNQNLNLTPENKQEIQNTMELAVTIYGVENVKKIGEHFEKNNEYYVNKYSEIMNDGIEKNHKNIVLFDVWLTYTLADDLEKSGVISKLQN